MKDLLDELGDLDTEERLALELAAGELTAALQRSASQALP